MTTAARDTPNSRQDFGTVSVKVALLSTDAARDSKVHINASCYHGLSLITHKRFVVVQLIHSQTLLQVITENSLEHLTANTVNTGILLLPICHFWLLKHAFQIIKIYHLAT